MVHPYSKCFVYGHEKGSMVKGRGIDKKKSLLKKTVQFLEVLRLAIVMQYPTICGYIMELIKGITI